MEPCQLFSGRTWRCPHSSLSINTNFLLMLLTNDSKDARFFFPAFKMARCQTSFSVMRRKSMLNITLAPKMIEFGRGMEMHDLAWWLGSNVRPQWWSGQPYVTECGRSPLIFVDKGVKLNQQNYRDDILVGALLPWAREHFKNRPWSFQQDSAPSLGAIKTQEWLSENVPHFITKEE